MNNLAAIGEMRGQPRLVAANLGEQIRQHAVRNRLTSCKMLMNGLEAELRLIRELAVARVALLDFNPDIALEALERAGQIAARLRRGRDQITIRILTARCLCAPEDAALRILAEAMSLAESFKLVRVVADDWPAAVECLPDIDRSGLARPAGVSATFIDGVAERCRLGCVPESAEPRSTASRSRPAQLSVREMEILGALSHGRSNKEIANMLDVGPEMVKWHMKNLFAKLNAANRRHAVVRARLLGTLE